jgi:hypothetical protein
MGTLTAMQSNTTLKEQLIEVDSKMAFGTVLVNSFLTMEGILV